ncbi:MAG: hypothetical protein V4505_09750 [Pseudomonadota bacterium]
MTLINDVIDTWKAYLAALNTGNKTAQADERHELIYDIRNFAFPDGKLSDKALDALGAKTDIVVVKRSDTTIAVTLPDDEVVEVSGKA